MGPQLHNCSFHGKPLRRMESAGLRLTEVTYDANLKNPQHSHEYAYIGVILDGNATQLCGGTVRSAKPWTVMYHPAGEVHSDQFHGWGARELNIEIAPWRLANLRKCSPHADHAVDVNGGKPGWLATRLYGEFRLMDELSSMAIEGLTIELMAEILRQNRKNPMTRSPQWLRQAKDLIRDRFTERLTLIDVAGAVGVHPVHLAREFHRHVGCTLGQQVRRLRIEKACCLLTESNESLAEIALATGFSDQSQFSKTFRMMAGVTPSEYRQSKSLR
ncbi:MAG: helix-turn-helix domain-containing protein [Terriglobia bacterium]